MIKKTSAVFLILSLLSGLVSAQEQVFTSTNNRKALVLYTQTQEYMMAKRYKEAELLLLKAVGQDSSYVDAWMRLSSIYYRTGRTQKEKEVYERVLQIRPEYPNVYFNYAYINMRQADYPQAIKYFNFFLEFDGTSEKFKKKAQKNIDICQYRKEKIEKPELIDPKNVGQGINTELNEYWPVLTADDANLYFTRLLLVDTTKRVGYGKYNEDIFVSEQHEKTWGDAVPLPGFLNSIDKNEGAIAISPDGTFLLFTICSDDPTFGMGWCDIWYSKYMDGKWQKPQNIGPPINTRMKETQPSISFDGKTIYFSSNRKGTLGKLDLWKSTLNDDGSWSTPVNLGPEINTEGNDQSPFIHPDDQTLYFSTDARLGMGESDLYMAKKDSKGVFQNVVNLGYPINTDKSEMALFVNARGNRAFYASRVEGGQGELDIYSFILPPKYRPQPVCYLKGKVLDHETKEVLGATFELIDLETGELVKKSNSDSKTGKFLVAIPAKANYAINVSKSGYLFYSEFLPIKDVKSTAYEHDVSLKPIKVGQKIALRNIFFDIDEYTLKPASKVELEKVIRFMTMYPEVKIEISGHTDNQGAPAHNKTLSQNRAKAVYDYLIEKGEIQMSRLSYTGYGESQPIDTNETEEGRANNRRTEIKVIGL